MTVPTVEVGVAFGHDATTPLTDLAYLDVAGATDGYVSGANSNRLHGNVAHYSAGSTTSSAWTASTGSSAEHSTDYATPVGARDVALQTITDSGASLSISTPTATTEQADVSDLAGSGSVRFGCYVKPLDATTSVRAEVWWDVSGSAVGSNVSCPVGEWTWVGGTAAVPSGQSYGRVVMRPASASNDDRILYSHPLIGDATEPGDEYVPSYRLRADMDVIVRATIDDLTPATDQTLAAQWDDSGKAWRFDLLSTGHLRFTRSGISDDDSTVTVGSAGWSDGDTLWLRVKRAGALTTFFVDDGSEIKPVNGTQLGSGVSSGTADINNVGSVLSVGALTGATPQYLDGKVYYVSVGARRTISGVESFVPVFVFDPWEGDGTNAYTTSDRRFTVSGSASVWSAFTDVVSYAHGVTVRRGRSNELEDVQPGSARFVLDNSDGRFDPNNTSGPYAGQVLPNVPVRIRALDPDDGTTWHDLFTGYVDAWSLRYERGLVYGSVEVSATDAFKILAHRRLPSSVYAYEVGVDAPVHHYRLGDADGTNAVDEGTSPVDGTYVGSPERATSSLVEHDGDGSLTPTVDGGVEVIKEGFTGVAAPHTYEMLINVPSFDVQEEGSGSEHPFLLRDGLNSVIILFNAGSPDWRLFYGDKTNETGRYGGTSLTAGTTYHVAFTYDGASTYGIYLNGIAESLTTAEVSGVYAGSGLWIGYDSSPIGGGYQPGPIIDEVAVYDSVLSPARILRHSQLRTDAWTNDLTGTRIGRILTMADWGPNDRDLDNGVTTMLGTDLNDGGGTALGYIRAVAQAEAGVVFIDPRGRVRFIDRKALVSESRHTQSQATFDDTTAGGHPYTDVSLSYGDREIYNEIIVQRKYGPTRRFVDTASVTSYLRRSLSRTGLLSDDDSEVENYGRHLLGLHAQPITTIDRITVDTPTTSGVWSKVLGCDLQDRITVTLDPPGAGDTFSQESLIEGVEHRVGPDRWRTTYTLSPANTGAYLQIDRGRIGNGRLHF